MKPTEDLFELINSLSKSEKRYFRIYSSLLSGKRKREMNYLKLFKEIEKQCKNGEYNEQVIKLKFKNENFIKQLTFTKNYLYNLIMKSLFNFYSDESSDFNSSLGVFKQKFLYSKSLFDQYFKGFKALKKNLERYEKFGQLSDVLKFERMIVKISKNRKNSYNSKQFFEEEEYFTNKIKNLTEYSKLFSKCINLQRDSGFLRSNVAKQKLNEIKTHNLISNEKNALSIRALEYLFLIKSLINELEGNIPEAIKYSIKRFELARDYPSAFCDSIIDIETDSINFILKYSMITSDKITYNKYSSIVNKSGAPRSDKIHIFNKIYNFLEFLKNKESDDRETNIQKINYIEEVIKENEKLLLKDYVLEFYFWAMFYSLEYGKYEDALKFSNKILNHPVNFSRIELLNLTRIYNLLIHYSLNNKNLLPYKIKSAEYNLKKEDGINQAEKTFLKFIRKLTLAKNISKEIQVLKKFKYEYNIIDDRIEKIFSIKNWIERIILLKLK